MWTPSVTGKVIDFTNIDPSSIDILDIAHSLSLQCRYNGNCRAFYSVAQHSVLMSTWSLPGHPFTRLMHDAEEFAIGDIISPVKEYIDSPLLRELGDNITYAIFKKYNVPPIDTNIHIADNIMLATERRDIMARCSRGWKIKEQPYKEKIKKGWSPEFAEQLFLIRFKLLYETQKEVKGCLAST